MKLSASTLRAIALVAALVLSACGGATTTTESDASEPATAETAATESDATESASAATGDAPVAEESLLTGDFVTTAGQDVNLADFQGQDVVLWFWAPW